MVSLDISLLYQIINFLFLIWILNAVLYKKIRKIVIERKTKIEGLKGTISFANKKSNEIEKDLADNIKQAKAEGVKIKNDATNEALEEEKKIISEINERTKKEITAIKEKIVKDTASVRDALKKEIE